MVAYRKSADSPTLKLTRSWVGPHITSPAINKFRAHAFQAAIKKARELGWSPGGRRAGASQTGVGNSL